MPTTKHFSLELEMKKLEAIEAYFQEPALDLDEALSKHQEALAIGASIITYLETAENNLKKIDIKTILNKTSIIPTSKNEEN